VATAVDAADTTEVVADTLEAHEEADGGRFAKRGSRLETRDGAACAAVAAAAAAAAGGRPAALAAAAAAAGVRCAGGALDVETEDRRLLRVEEVVLTGAWGLIWRMSNVSPIRASLIWQSRDDSVARAGEALTSISQGIRSSSIIMSNPSSSNP